MTDVAKSFERIQDQALDSRAPLSDTLRLCVAVGGQVNARELIEWATAELSGYKGGRELPSYRSVSAQLLMDYMNGTAHVSHSTIPHGWLDDEIRELLADVPLSFPVRALEGMAADDDGARLTPVDVETLMVLVNTQARRNRNEFFNITGLYWHVPQLVLAGVLDQIRTRLVELVAEFDVAIARPGTDAVTAARSAVHVVVESGGSMTMNSAPNGTIVSGGDHAVVTSSSARRDVIATTAGRTIKGYRTNSSTAGRTLSPSQRRWWTKSKIAYGAVTVLLAVSTIWFACLAL